jgi:hypothetical protein
MTRNFIVFVVVPYASCEVCEEIVAYLFGDLKKTIIIELKNIFP